MALILNIDTATEKATICLSKDGQPLQILHNPDQKDHAAWLHVAIEKMMATAGYAIKQLDAVAVTSGPGSYTGLRVGMATAKGLCYALGIPLLTENTLKVMAFAAAGQQAEEDMLFCPMIDARRMEVFTAVYDRNMQELMSPVAMVLDEHAFTEKFTGKKLVFFGNGSIKWRSLAKSTDYFFTDPPMGADFLGILSHKKFADSQFTDIIYSEPVYTKEFYTHTKK